MSKVKLQEAKALIEAKQYSEARELLKTIDHPTAKKWLVRLKYYSTDNEEKKADQSPKDRFENALAFFRQNAQELQETYKELQEKLDREHRELVLKHKDKFSEEIFNMLMNREIAIDMTEEMVLISWGAPSSVDQHEITSKRTKKRWIYGTPRQEGVKYIWFVNGKVTKIKAD